MSWPDSRRAGVCLHISSLPGPFGIGELGRAAFDFIDQLVAMETAVWQFLPLGPTAYADSPYQPLSSFAGNPLFIDIADLISLGLLTEREARPLTKLPQDRVDFGRLIPLKARLLSRAAQRFPRSAPADLRQGYQDYVERHDKRWLHEYALFRVLKGAHHERAWPDWQPRFRDRKTDALTRFANQHADEITAIKIAQYLFHRQWQALHAYARQRGVVMFGDIPIYIALDSADAWSQREMLALHEQGQPQLVAGVPPDYFSADGQLWGNPVYNWSYQANTDYRWWIQRCAHTTGMMDLVRVDHFRGFAGYWAVAAGAKNAREGAWEPGPGHAIFDALKRALGKLPIVAEDLGVITPDVIELREKHDIPGMVVLQFDAADANFDRDAIPADSVCYTGTHDNDTTVGWFNGGPGDTRTAAQIAETQRVVLANTNGSPATIHLDMLRLAFSSTARIAIAPMQDYLGLGSEARMNTPGVERGNWQWRLRDGQLSPALAGQIATMCREAGRTGSE